MTTRSISGVGNYFETIQRQGYTNNGFIIGDWIGREAKGGQAWVTYHLSGNESIAVQYLRKKNGKDFDGGSTQNMNFEATSYQWDVNACRIRTNHTNTC